MSYRPTPSQLAHWDQAHTEASGLLDGLIKAHRAELAESGERREVCMGGLASFLGQSDPGTLACVLAVAVDRLTEQEAT